MCVCTWQGKYFSKEILYSCHVCTKSSCNMHLKWLASSGYFYFFLGLSLQVSVERSYTFFIPSSSKNLFCLGTLSSFIYNFFPRCQLNSNLPEFPTNFLSQNAEFYSIIPGWWLFYFYSFLSLPLNSFKIGLAIFSKLQVFFFPWTSFHSVCWTESLPSSGIIFATFCYPQSCQLFNC